jgi:hypothetical protein
LNQHKIDKMEKDSKVAYCESCNKMVMAGAIEHLDKESEKEFTDLSNEGFIVKTETKEETKKRDWAFYSDCIKGICS